jgi:crotonobetainyl-CoA:carnitine CoA-transferase CaiB-like acyl-CoA transferase
VTQFKNLKVLELASVLAGPSVGQFFAELGAEVIKVENIKTGGDVTRSWKLATENSEDRSAYFSSVNWGKKSIALDLTSTEDQKIVHQLSVKAHIVIASYKPGDAEKLGVDYKTLSNENPGLIYGQISGYGSENHRVGYDAIIQAETGFMFMNGEPGGPSLKMPVALIDILAGHHLKEGLLLAMLEKTITGKGKLVEVSLIQTAIASLANQATNWLVAGNLPEKHGSAHPNIAPYGDVFITKDKKEILLAIGNDRQFQDLCSVLEISSIALDEKFLTNQKRVQNRDQLNKTLESKIAQRSSHELMPLIHQKKIPAGLIQNMKEVFEMKEAKEMLLESDGLKGVITFAERNSGFLSVRSKNQISSPPHLGQHTEEILKSL